MLTGSDGWLGPGDGCTFWLDSWFGIDLTHCCDVHDERFAVGRQLGEFVAANLELLQCGSAAGAPLWAILAFVGVMSPVGLYLFLFGRKRQNIR